MPHDHAIEYDTSEIPDGIEPLIGYRGWGFKADELFSCYRLSVRWPVAGPLVAQCLDPVPVEPSRPKNAPAHYIYPEKACTCGIYALHSYPKAWTIDEAGERTKAKPWPPNSITGVVQGWGKTVMGTTGFRSQYMRPIALVARRHKFWMPIIEEIAFHYGLEIVEAADVRAETTSNLAYLNQQG